MRGLTARMYDIERKVMRPPFSSVDMVEPLSVMPKYLSMESLKPDTSP